MTYVGTVTFFEGTGVVPVDEVSTGCTEVVSTGLSDAVVTTFPFASSHLAYSVISSAESTSFVKSNGDVSSASSYQPMNVSPSLSFGTGITSLSPTSHAKSRYFDSAPTSFSLAALPVSTHFA